MNRIMAATALLAAITAAAPAWAFAEGSFSVRNDTGESQNCSIRRAGSNYAEPIILRAAGEWSGTSRSDRPSVLICRGPARDMTFRMQSGRRYALTKTGAGTLVLANAN